MDYYIDKIKSGKLKVTQRRKAIVRLFEESGIHLTAQEVWENLKKQFSRCGLPGVYRNLESLVECGVLTRIQKFDDKRHYGLCPGAHVNPHHHIICIKCGRIDDINQCAIKGAKDIKGYKVVSHFMQVNAICEACLVE